MSQDNRKKLRGLMVEHDLDNQKVADMLSCSIYTVNEYTSETGYQIPNHKLELLELKLKQNKPEN